MWHVKNHKTNMRQKIIRYQKALPAARLLTVLIGVVFSVSVLMNGVSLIGAQQVQDLQRQSSELRDEINAVNRQASQLQERADSLAEALEELDEQITESEQQIAETSQRIDVLQEELDEAQAELDRQKGLLRSSMRALYKRGGASTFEMLAASESFSEFIDEQEYLERLKISIQESTNRVIALRLQIQQQQDAQKVLLAQQESVKRSLDAARQERAQLLDATRSEADRLREYGQSLAERQREVNRELLRLSRVVNVGGSGEYPWANALCVYTDSASGPCRHPTNSAGDYEWYVGDRSNRRDPWGYFYRNCTSYVAWKSAKLGFELDLAGSSRRGLGDGGAWARNASQYPELSVGTTPKVGSFAVFNIGGFGHVAFVEEVRGAEVLISEYNFVADGVYSERWISRHQPTSYVYTPFSR